MSNNIKESTDVMVIYAKGYTTIPRSSHSTHLDDVQAISPRKGCLFL